MFEIIHRDKRHHKPKLTLSQKPRYYFLICLLYLNPITWWRMIFWKITQTKNFYNREMCYVPCDDKQMVKYLSKSLGTRYIDWDYMIYIHGGGMPNIVLRIKKQNNFRSDDFIYFMYEQYEALKAAL